MLPIPHQSSLRMLLVAIAMMLVAAGCGTTSEVDASGSGTAGSATSSEGDVAGTAQESDASDDAADDTEPPDDDNDDGDGQDSDDPETASSTDLFRPRSPIAEFLGQDVGDAESGEAERMEMEAQAEIATAECMQELGFEYIPRDVSADLMMFGPPPEFDPFSDEYIETYGFGMTTQMFPQSMVGPDLVGFPDEDMPGMGPDFEPPDDPNQEYIDALSDGAREVYYEALHGAPPDFDPSTMTEDEMNDAMMNFRPSGCYNEAREAIYGGPDGKQREFYETFGDEMQNIHRRVESDPRIIAQQDEVAACVSEKGLDFDGDMENLFQRLTSRLDPVMQAGPMGGDPFAEAGLNPDDMSQEEIDDFFANLPPPRLSIEAQQILAEVQAEEIALAIAMNDCGGGQRAAMELYQTVRVEYEERFLAENADALAPYAAD